MSGLSGTLDVLSGTENMNTNTFAGPIKVRNATLNLNVSQTLPGAGAITLGMPENASNLIATIPTLSVASAAAGSTFNRDIISDNGSTNAAGKVLRYSFLPGISALSNSTGTQTFTGNVTLNTGLRLQGGGASSSSTGATVFTGNISGPGIFAVANGRAIFSGNYSNTGGFLIGDGGFTARVAFTGTGSGSGSMLISSSFGGGVNATTMSYVNGGLQSGPIMVWNSTAGAEPQIIPLNNSTINNEVRLGIGSKPGEEGDAVVNVGSGITANWNGPLTGFSPLTKAGTGQLGSWKRQQYEYGRGCGQCRHAQSERRAAELVGERRKHSRPGRHRLDHRPGVCQQWWNNRARQQHRHAEHRSRRTRGCFEL